MKHILKTAVIALVGVLALTTVSCSSSRGSSRDNPRKELGIPPRSQVAAPQWTNVQMPVKLSLAKPRNFNVSGRATMVRGQQIYLSLRFFGMEVATVNITPDSVTVADRFHKLLFTESTSKVMGRTGYDINTMQDIILGMDPSIENPLEIENGFGNKVGTIKFSDFVETPAGVMASVIEADGKIKKTDVEVSLEWNPKRAQWNDPALVPPGGNSYNGYRTFGLPEVTEMLNSLGEM